MKYLVLLFVALLTITLSACQQGPQSISPEEARDLLESDDSVILLDVRTFEEYRDEHIPGAVLIPLAVLSDELPSNYPNFNTTFIVYCRSGNRSQDAVNIMASLGYKNVYDLGGIIDWPYQTQSL